MYTAKDIRGKIDMNFTYQEPDAAAVLRGEANAQ